MKLTSLNKRGRLVVAAFRLAFILLYCDFLILITSSGFHWWTPAWGGATGWGMFNVLVILCITCSLPSAFALNLNLRAYKKHGYNLLVLRQIIASVERLLLLALCGLWGLSGLAGHPTRFLLELLLVVCFGGTLGFILLEVYDLRHIRQGSVKH